MSEIANPTISTYGKVCYFIGATVGRQNEFLDVGEDSGYSLEEPLYCPITGKEIAEYGYTDPSGNTGMMHFRELTNDDSYLAWEAFAGESSTKKSDKAKFRKWLKTLTDSSTAKAIVDNIEWI